MVFAVLQATSVEAFSPCLLIVFVVVAVTEDSRFAQLHPCHFALVQRIRPPPFKSNDFFPAHNHLNWGMIVIGTFLHSIIKV